MTDQMQPGSVISLESAALEFSNAFSLTIARLVTEKLELLEQNTQLRAIVAKLEKDIDSLKEDGELINSRPKMQSDSQPERMT